MHSQIESLWRTQLDTSLGPSTTWKRIDNAPQSRHFCTTKEIRIKSKRILVLRNARTHTLFLHLRPILTSNSLYYLLVRPALSPMPSVDRHSRGILSIWNDSMRRQSICLWPDLNLQRAQEFWDVHVSPTTNAESHTPANTQQYNSLPAKLQTENREWSTIVIKIVRTESRWFDSPQSIDARRTHTQSVIWQITWIRLCVCNDERSFRKFINDVFTSIEQFVHFRRISCHWIWRNAQFVVFNRRQWLLQRFIRIPNHFGPFAMHNFDFRDFVVDGVSVAQHHLLVSRTVHPFVVDFAVILRLGHKLRCIFGSERNVILVRVARRWHGRRHILCIDHIVLANVDGIVIVTGHFALFVFMWQRFRRIQTDIALFCRRSQHRQFHIFYGLFERFVRQSNDFHPANGVNKWIFGSNFTGVSRTFTVVFHRVAIDLWRVPSMWQESARTLCECRPEWKMQWAPSAKRRIQWFDEPDWK